MTTLEEARREMALAEHEIARLTGLIKPLKAELKRVQAEHLAAAEIVATLVQSDAELLAVSGTRHGYNRLDEIARGLHPAVSGFCRWAPPEARNVGPNTPIQTQVGLALRLDYKPSDEYLTTLADALREFNRRFVNYTPPAGTTNQYAGFADLLARRDGRYCHIEFDPAPDGKAVLMDRDEAVCGGTLRHVLERAAAYAWYNNGPDDDDCDTED